MIHRHAGADLGLRSGTERLILEIFEGYDAAHVPFEEVLLAFLGFQKDGSSDRDRAQQWNGHVFASGEDSVHVVHVDWDEFEIGSFFGYVVQSAFEFTHFAVDRAAPFWEDDQGVGVPYFTQHQFDGALVDFDLFSVDEDRVEGLGKKPAKRGLPPVVLSGHRAGQLAKASRERSPENDRIEVAGVIGKVDALAGIGFGPDPADRETAEKLGDQRQTLARQAAPRGHSVLGGYRIAFCEFGQGSQMALRETESEAEPFATQKIGLRGDDSRFFKGSKVQKSPGNLFGLCTRDGSKAISKRVAFTR